MAQRKVAPAKKPKPLPMTIYVRARLNQPLYDQFAAIQAALGTVTESETVRAMIREKMAQLEAPKL